MALFLISCENAVNMVELKPSMVIEELSDSTYFKDVLCIMHNGENIYASDTYNGRILKFDTQMKYLECMGARGYGPEEFAGMGGIAILKDTLYIVDYSGLKSFTKDGTFIETVKIHDLNIDPFIFCMDESGYIYFSSRTDTLPLVKYDRSMNRQFAFGNRLGQEDEKISANMYMLHYFNNEIVSVKRDEPIITIYNKKGEILLTKRIENKIFDSRLSFKRQEQEKEPMNRKKTYHLFESITSFENKIYLLYINHDSQNHIPSCNHIVELVYENNNFHVNNVYQLEDKGWYISICHVDNKLVCYSGSKQEFHIYEL
jgi:glutamine cyclotransferase